jgi:tRNA G10  N-methylase Trm11
MDPIVLYGRLLEAASRILRVGGRFVYLYPFDRSENRLCTLQDIPTHPSFELLDFCEEFLTMKVSRILISMKKIM